MCLPSVYLVFPHIAQVTRSSRPSSRVSAYWKQSNTGGSKGLGTTRLNQLFSADLDNSIVESVVRSYTWWKFVHTHDHLKLSSIVLSKNSSLLHLWCTCVHYILMAIVQMPLYSTITAIIYVHSMSYQSEDYKSIYVLFSAHYSQTRTFTRRPKMDAHMPTLFP